MRTRLLATAFVTVMAAPLLGQEAPPPVSITLDEPTSVFSRDYRPAEEPTPIARAISLALGATFFAEVKISTAGPVIELSRLNHQGFYKLELIELLLMCAKAGKPLHDAVSARRKGKSLEALSLSYGLSYDDIHEAALAVQEIVDREYLPRFPLRRPRKQRDEP